MRLKGWNLAPLLRGFSKAAACIKVESALNMGLLSAPEVVYKHPATTAG